MKLTTNDALNFGSVLCVSVSMATVIQEAKNDIDAIVDKVEKIKGDKDE